MIATCVWSIFDLLIRVGEEGWCETVSELLKGERVESSVRVQFLTSSTRTSPTNSEDAKWTRAWTTMTSGNGEAGGAGLPLT